MELVLRPLSIENAAEAALLAAPYPESWSENAFQEALLAPAGRLYGAFHGEELVAFCAFSTAAGEASLNLMAVKNALRGAGVGRALLSGALLRLEKEGVKEVYLEVRASNRAAIALYTGAGFVQTGLRAGFYRAPAEDALTMRRLFEN